jgi:hypothetical protein
MKLIALAFAVIFLLLPMSILAFVCKGKIIGPGDQIDLVTAHCGEPSSRRTIKQEITGGSSGTMTQINRRQAVYEGTSAASVEQVEILIYNCGAGRLIQRLQFKGGKLEKEETIGHGSGPQICD